MQQNTYSKFPTTSETSVSTFSIRSGYWFYFNVNNLEIAVNGSAWSGKEVVYVNDNPVSNKRNWHFSSEHEFEQGGHAYKIVFNVVDMMLGKLECELWVDDKLAETQSLAYFSKNKNKSWWELLGGLGIFFGAGLVFGIVAAKLVKAFVV